MESELKEGSFRGVGVAKETTREPRTREYLIIMEEGFDDMKEWSITRMRKDGISLSKRLAKRIGLNSYDEVEVIIRRVRSAEEIHAERARIEESLEAIRAVEAREARVPPPIAVPAPPAPPPRMEEIVIQTDVDKLPDGMEAIVNRPVERLTVGEPAPPVKRGPGRPRKVR